VRSFSYLTPATVEEAVAAAAGALDVAYLGGGTNLVDLMRLGVARPAVVVDVNAILPRSVEATESGGLLLGAGLPNSDLAADPRVRSDYPVLSQAVLAGASGQIRNMATVGGNLLQRTRCLYFQDVSKPCNKRVPGSGCPARSGIHRDLAILGGSEHCIATHPSDLAVALAALDAVVHVRGSDGVRRLSLDELYRLPGDDPSRDTTLRPGDLVVGVELPAASALSRRSAYRKVRDRASYAFAVSSVAAGVHVVDGRVAEVAIALGAVAHRPWRARVAEQALQGAPLSRAAVQAAVGLEMQSAHLLPGNAFKADLSGRVAAEVLDRLAAGNGSGEEAVR
jgi:xanthine dehydrogenase YagS FAD-binding subunit